MTAPAPTTAAPVTSPRPTGITPPRPPVSLAPVSSASASDYSLIGYRWNPCQVVTVSSTGPDVGAIVSELAGITGLQLQMVNGPAEITVRWGAAGGGGELGSTSWQVVGHWLATSTIIIGAQGAPDLATVLHHELAHAMGLSHARQSNEVMYPFIGSYSPPDYQAGDLAALRAVGATGGC